MRDELGYSLSPAMTSPAKRTVEHVRIGAYLHSRRDLYRVEAVNGDYALMEDCRSGELIDMPLRELRDLTPVEPTGRGRRSRGPANP